ncbi:MAG: hypothetical protein ACJ763_04240 [Bdellovibrionia bacterium]
MFAINAMAGGGGVRGGGGDICEDRIQQIRDDIKSWIHQGGAQGLSLPQGVSADRYADLMLDQMKTARVKCVGAADKGYPVAIGSTPKVCKFSIDQSGSQITCDYIKFLATNESDQYVLIHHEYAGLAGVEVPNQGDSRYDVSNQISAYLEDQVVKKLAVKPVTSELQVGSRVVIDDNQFETKTGQITSITSGKYTYYQVRLSNNSGRAGDEQIIERSYIKATEVGSLNGVRKGQKAICRNIYDISGSAFEGNVAHIYSNGFVEITISTKKATSVTSTSQLSEGPLFLSSVPGAWEIPRFGYNCSY